MSNNENTKKGEGQQMSSLTVELLLIIHFATDDLDIQICIIFRIAFSCNFNIVFVLFVAERISPVSDFPPALLTVACSFNLQNVSPRLNSIV